MKKIFVLVSLLLVVSLVFMGCQQQVVKPKPLLSEDSGIQDVDNVGNDINGIDEDLADSELENLEHDLDEI